MSRRKVFMQYVDAIPDSSIKDHLYKRAGKTTDIQAFRDRTGKKNFHFDVKEFTKAEPNGDQWHVLEVQGAYSALSKSVVKSGKGGNQAKTSTYAMLRVHRDADPSPSDFKEALKSAGSRCDEKEERAKRGKEKLQSDIQQKNDAHDDMEKKRAEDIAARTANRNLEKGKGKGKGKDTSGYK